MAESRGAPLQWVEQLTSAVTAGTGSPHENEEQRTLLACLNTYADDDDDHATVYTHVQQLAT
jgi:hypothetical protein